MPFITTDDGTQIFYKDQGTGQPVLFSHGWPLTSDAWDGQMVFMGQNGFRVIAHDRRSHGRSSQTWGGNHMDQYADDLAEMIEALSLSDIILVGRPPGGGEAVQKIDVPTLSSMATTTRSCRSARLSCCLPKSSRTRR